MKLLKQLDWRLIITLFMIFTFGIVILSSATHVNQTGNYSRLIKQSIAFALGIGMIILMLAFDYNFIGQYYKELYIASVVLLAIVLTPLGAVRGGARSTLDLGPLDLQTAELVKLTFILSYAKIVELKKGRMDKLKDILNPSTIACNRSPFSSKNLLKSDYKIPDKDLEAYKNITANIPKENLISLVHISQGFMNEIVKNKKQLEEYNIEKKQLGMKPKEYFHYKGYWEEYLQFLKKENLFLIKKQIFQKLI